MRLVAAAVFAGLALIAGSVVYYTFETREEDPYVNAEEIVSAVYSAIGSTPASVRRVSGPYVMVKRDAEQCDLVDISTQYQGEAGPDFFWVVYSTGDRKSVDC